MAGQSLLEVEHRDDTTLVHFPDRKILDESSIQVVGMQLEHLAEQAAPRRLVVNFGNLEYLTSHALAKFVFLHLKLEAAGSQLVLFNIRPDIRNLLAAADLNQFFHIAEDVPTPRRPVVSVKKASPRRPPNAPRAGPPVVLFDPRPDRAGRLSEAMAGRLEVLRLDDLGALTRYCLEHEPVAVALPLHPPGEPPPDKRADSPVLQFIREQGRRLAIFVYADTTRLPVEAYCAALAAGAKQVLNEDAPSFPEQARDTLLRVVRDHEAARDEQEQLAGLFARHGLIGRSPALREVFHRAVKASHFSDIPVLLLGETGTGKQRLAEAIHRLDPQRRDRPFVTLNCSAITQSLAESELFGHARGAFSGAERARLGLFRAANGGTLLLDEVGELSPELQPKLLRVLQDQRLLPVGADYEHPIDVRIIAATNRPLEQMVAEGKFRDDLYQRLNVFRIVIPPLRERPEDVESQACFFLEHFRAGRGRPVRGFGPRVLEVLRLLPWEGNSRQLENLLREILAHMDQGDLVQMEDLPRWVVEAMARLSPPARAADSLDDQVRRACERKLSLNEAMEEYERRLLQSVLEQNQGNRTRTAAVLGLTPRSVFNKIRKYRLDRL